MKFFTFGGIEFKLHDRDDIENKLISVDSYGIIHAKINGLHIIGPADILNKFWDTGVRVS